MKFNIERLRALDPCSDGLTWAESQPDAATGWEQCPRGDWLLWLLERVQPLTKEQSVRLAVAFAKEALPQFTQQHPNDDRPAKAIAAAEAWLGNPSSAAESAAWSAASAAWSAASAARSAASAARSAAESAAWSAASAAWSADSAASVAWSADSAASAAWSADNAASVAWSADSAARRRQADIIRSLIPNPFAAKQTTTSTKVASVI